MYKLPWKYFLSLKMRQCPKKLILPGMLQASYHLFSTRRASARRVRGHVGLMRAQRSLCYKHMFILQVYNVHVDALPKHAHKCRLCNVC